MVILDMLKALVTSKSTFLLLLIISAFFAIRWYCAIIRKLNSKRGI